MILRILASIFTGIGGHFLNRRWDKAVLFLCLFVCSWIAAYAFFIFSLQYLSGPAGGMEERFESLNLLTSRVFTAGIFVIWLLSLIITIADCKKSVEPNIARWTKSGVTGAVLTSILSFFLLAYTVGLFAADNFGKTAGSEPASYTAHTSSFHADSFYENIYFGGTPASPFNLPAPPAGNVILKGKITYKDNPAEGVSLSVVLNSKYKADDITTDAEGIFSINLPPGTWTINAIYAEGWEKIPKQGNFTMYYGGEEKLQGTIYNRYGYSSKSGYPVTVTPEALTPQLNITIRDDIQLIWPSPDSEGVKATLDDSISWVEVPGASRYYIKLSKVSREGESTYYEQVATTIVADATSIPLSSFKHRTTGGNESTEYAAELYAFAEDGTLVAEFSDTFEGGTFLLSDGNILIQESLEEIFNLSSIQDPDEFKKTIEAISLNEARGNAVAVLIEDDLLDEAETVLNLMDSEYSKGKKEALSGYMFALQAECEKANEMFAQAESINPGVCIPDNYRANCK